MQTFLWHDYETFGADPRHDRPAQFAAIRTDAELNPIGEPIMSYCQPAPDYLPDPVACLITGITPQLCLQQGIPEYQFAQHIEHHFSQPGTIGVGYNSIKFDDEFTRFMFWRNLIDPYAREWQNECGRWDLLNVMRAAYALRPEGLEWPLNAENKHSFRLEHLSVANGVTHDSAHDALSDVRATIGLARRLRLAQPKLFDFCLELRHKSQVTQHVNLTNPSPFLHVSGMIPVERGCLMLAWPLAAHPSNKNELIVWDLAYDPTELFSLDADTVRLRMFSKTGALPAGVSRLPIKTLHINQSPIVISQIKTLTATQAERWGMDLTIQLRHADILRNTPPLDALWQAVYRRESQSPADVDADLYSGFIGKNDRQTMEHLRQLDESGLRQARPTFYDARLEKLFFRYRARNFPHLLDDEERLRWQQHCYTRLHEGAAGVRNFQQLSHSIDELANHANERDEALLSDLYDYAESIAE